MHLAGRTWGWGRRLLIEDPVQGHVLLDTFSLLCEDGGWGTEVKSAASSLT